jgi:hypothetical protein
MRGIAGFFEHPPVEREPTQLAIEISRFGLSCVRSRRRRCGNGRCGYAVHQFVTKRKDARVGFHCMSPN